MRKIIVAAALGALLTLHAGPAKKAPPKKGDLKGEFKRVADPPKRTKFEKPQKNYDPPKPKPPAPR